MQGEKASCTFYRDEVVLISDLFSAGLLTRSGSLVEIMQKVDTLCLQLSPSRVFEVSQCPHCDVETSLGFCVLHLQVPCPSPKTALLSFQSLCGVQRGAADFHHLAAAVVSVLLREL